MSENHDYDWSSARVPGNVTRVICKCTECGDEITLSPRLATEFLPKIYCDCDEIGYPYEQVEVKFKDGSTLEKD